MLPELREAKVIDEWELIRIFFLLKGNEFWTFCNENYELVHQFNNIAKIAIFCLQTMVSFHLHFMLQINVIACKIFKRNYKKS